MMQDLVLLRELMNHVTESGQCAYSLDIHMLKSSYSLFTPLPCFCVCVGSEPTTLNSYTCASTPASGENRTLDSLEVGRLDLGEWICVCECVGVCVCV